MRLAGFRVDCFCRGPWRDLFNTRNSLSWFLMVEQPVRRREQRQGVVKVNAGARLVMERASFSLGRQTPARRSTLIPSTPLRGTPRAAALRSFYIEYILCGVFPPSHYVSRTHCRSPAFSHACALAWMSMNVEVVKGAKFLHGVH